MVIRKHEKIDNFIKRNGVDGIEILGAAIGSDVFVSSCLLKRLKKLEDKLANLDNYRQFGICRRISMFSWYFAFLHWCSQNDLLFAKQFSFGRIK